MACCRVADDAGIDRFHLYGHSAGGAVALALALAHPDRVLTLAVDEPASDFTDQGNAAYGWAEFERALQLPPERLDRRVPATAGGLGCCLAAAT
jgi:pimeloyl-ACP methyl ester carboxylesterase